MRRPAWLGTLLIGFAVMALMVGPVAGTRAQDDKFTQATEVADLQTRVAQLETVVTTGTEDAAATGTPVQGHQPERPPVSHGGTPAAGVLYQADANGGFEAWTDVYMGGFENPFLVQNGILVYPKGFYTILFAPYLTTSPDYVVEAEMRISTPTGEVAAPSAGIVVRYMDDPATLGKDEGYIAGLRWLSGPPPTIKGVIEAEEYTTLASLDLTGAGLPNPTDSWHTYRFEVKGDHLRYLIDGNLIAEATDDSFSGVGLKGRIGIVASGVPIEVRSFRILAG